MKGILVSILTFLWPALGAALKAYWGKEQEEAQAEAQEVIQHEARIKTDTEKKKHDVADLTESELDTELRK